MYTTTALFEPNYWAAAPAAVSAADGYESLAPLAPPGVLYETACGHVGPAYDSLATAPAGGYTPIATARPAPKTASLTPSERLWDPAQYTVAAPNPNGQPVPAAYGRHTYELADGPGAYAVPFAPDFAGFHAASPPDGEAAEGASSLDCADGYTSTLTSANIALVYSQLTLPAEVSYELAPPSLDTDA